MKTSLILALGTAALLAACGGRSDPPATSEVPASASESAGGFVRYLQALIASDADAYEPVDVSTVTPPADDTGEPTPID